MKVILKADVKKVGKAGEVIEVAEGYGRNFLLPKGLAAEANAKNLNLARQKAGAAAHKKAQETDEARLLAAQLDKVEAVIAVKVGEGGKLFGSVTGKDVAEALHKAHGIELDKRKITLIPEVNGPGDYEAVIKIHPEIVSRIKVRIVAE